MRLASFLVLVVLSLGVAGYAAVAYGFFPLGAAVHPGMRAMFEAHRVGIYVHIFGSMIALAFGPFQFLEWLRTNHTAVHRWMGRFYLAAGVLIGGLAGLYMALHAFGGFVARLGFACLAVAWLYTGFRAYSAVRARDLASHRCWMVRNFALTFAAVTLRLWLPASMVSGFPFEMAYGVIAWLCWVPNLLVAEFMFNRRHSSSLERRATGKPLSPA